MASSATGPAYAELNEDEIEARTDAALAALLAGRLADTGLSGRLVAAARRYARARGAEVVDVTSEGAAADAPPPPADPRRVHYVWRAPETEALFTARAFPPKRVGNITYAYAPAVALLFRRTASGGSRYLAIPSEGAFTEAVFADFMSGEG